MVKTISMQDFVKRNEAETLNVIDVREFLEYKLGGHIPGASNMPLSKLNKKYQELSKDEEYLIVCQSGGRSAQATDFLAQMGYNVTNVQGGMGMWQGKVER